jgi:hypothetical protein
MRNILIASMIAIPALIGPSLLGHSNPYISRTGSGAGCSEMVRAAYAGPGPVENINEIRSLTDTMLAWIARKTELDVPNRPQIAFVSKQELREKFTGLKSDKSDLVLELRAVYLPVELTIYLPDTWQPSDAIQKSILLHELVHHVQTSNKLTFPCRGARERMAFELQALWLREQGIAAPYEAIGTDEFTVAIMTSCRDDQ